MSSRSEDPAAIRPRADEHLPYYGPYIECVPDGSVIDRLRAQGDSTRDLLRAVPEGVANSRYAPGKWSLKEVVGHLIDSERVFALRALAFARAERAPLFGFEQDEWVAAAGFDRRPIADLREEFATVRAATISLLRGLNEEQWGRRGVANDAECSVRAAAWIIAGHEAHHLDVIRERYLGR